MHKQPLDIKKKLSAPVKLPTIAKNIHILMQALADQNLSYQQLATIIKQYPEITARLLFLANSSWSSPIAPITNIEQACSRLGISIVKSISIALSISSTFDTRSCPLFDTVYFWTSSMLVSEAAGALTSKLPSTNIELEQTAQTAGIIHNLGLLWLAENLPTETNTALEAITTNTATISLNSSLNNTIDTDYCQIGGWLAKELKFPTLLVETIKFHLSPDYNDSSWETSIIVGEAARMTSALHQQSDEISTNTRLENLGINAEQQQLVFQQLSKNFNKTQQLAQTLFKA